MKADNTKDEILMARVTQNFAVGCQFFLHFLTRPEFFSLTIGRASFADFQISQGVRASPSLRFPERRYDKKRSMFANFLQLISRRPATDDSERFVEGVKLVNHVPKRNRRAEKLFLVCWLLIAGKCWLIIWLVDKYHMKLNPLWVNAPTIAFALLCTAVYFFRDS
jgi:hypothetical protein